MRGERCEDHAIVTVVRSTAMQPKTTFITKWRKAAIVASTASEG